MSIRKKKLIEVALPLAEINEACVDDKDRKTGHIRGLHKWFAPMPLPAWRALLFASIVDDPGNRLPQVEAQKERDRLFKIIERLVQFDAAQDFELLEEVKSLLEEHKPKGTTVVDPFCGGGSTALEAQRLGFETLATDLNPIPVLITTLLTNALPFASKVGPISSKTSPPSEINSDSIENLKKDFTYYAEKVSSKTRKKLEKLFPKNSSGKEIFAWRWAWAVKSPHPSAKGGYTPLVTDWELWRAKGKSTWIVPEVNVRKNEISFSIREGGKKIPSSVANRSATCLFTGRPIPLDYIREEGKEGRLRPMLLAGVANAGSGLRHFIAPNNKYIEATNLDYPEDAPTLEMPLKALGFRVQEYGITDFRKLFLPRQSHVLCAFADAISSMRDEIISDAVKCGLKNTSKGLLDNGSDAQAYADTIMLFLSLCLGKMAQANNILTRWVIDPRNGTAKAVQAFDRHAIPMVWDFVETNPFGGSVGDWLGPVVKTALLALNLYVRDGVRGNTGQLDARNLPDSLAGRCLIATDPPYYANIGYADLSDFFYIWHRRALRNTFPNLFRTIGTPKTSELIASPFRHEGDRRAADEFFRNGFKEVFSKAVKLQHPDLPMVIVYAYKQKDSDDPGIVGTGWEAMLEAITDSGLSVVGTLPIRAVRKARMINIGTNSLASAVAIICRRPDSNRKVATKRDFLNSLRKEIPPSLSVLTQSGIAPVDLAQALIGPGMAVYCSYEKVLEADDNTMSVKGALESINQIVTETITKQDGSFDPETRWCLTWFEQNGFKSAEYGDANLLAQAKNISVERLCLAGIVNSKSGKVQLVSRPGLKDDWEPKDASVWLATQYLIKYLQEGGERQAGLLFRDLGAFAVDCKDIAYRCYAICQKNGWSSEAVAFNSLILSWSEITKLAASQETNGL